MSTIQTVIVNEWIYDRENSGTNVFFLEEAPEVVKASIKLEDCDNDGISNTRTVYSIEEYMEMQTRPLSDFCPPAAKKGIWWLAVDDEDCLNILREVRGLGTHNKNRVEHFHVTLAYNVTKDDKPAYLVAQVAHGKTFEFGTYTIIVKGLAYNDKCAALVVDVKGMEYCSRHPHITLATAEGVPPVYSNEMLAGVDGAYNFLPLEAELEGTLEFFQFK